MREARAARPRHAPVGPNVQFRSGGTTNKNDSCPDNNAREASFFSRAMARVIYPGRMLFVGAAFFMLGVLVFMVVIFSSGGVAKSQQFRVLGEVSRGQHGAGKRLGLGIAVLLIVVGACGAFAGTAQKDAARRTACDAKCKTDGFEQGKLGPSTERHPQQPNKHRFVACICSGGKDTVEFDSGLLNP